MAMDLSLLLSINEYLAGCRDDVSRRRVLDFVLLPKAQRPGYVIDLFGRTSRSRTVSEYRYPSTVRART